MTGLGDRLPAAGLRLAAAAVDARNSVLVLIAGGPPDSPFVGPFMRSARRAPFQTLLAADLLVAGRSAAPTDVAPDAALVRAVRRRVGAGAAVYVVTRRPIVAPGQIEVVIGDRSAWQGLLADLVRRCTRSAIHELVAAQRLVMEWARGDRTRFDGLRT